MAGASLRLCHRLSTPLFRQSNLSSQKFTSRTLTSATQRSSNPPSRFPRRTSISTSPKTVPDLCLGAGGKAPGFVQQMLFSAPVQGKNANERINQNIRVLLGNSTTNNRNASSSQSNPSQSHSPYKFSH